MRYQRFTQWVAVAALLVLAGGAQADDRDFMRTARAEPNLIFILDTSSSMVAVPEITGYMLPESECDPDELIIDSNGDGTLDTADPNRCLNGAWFSSSMVPGGGDDPASRMGIAKRVLRDFLEDVNDANVALAGYAQAEPADGSNGIPQKHWVYESRANDRFRMVEEGYAYRFGYNWTFSDLNIDVPADVYKAKLIGYNLNFDPSSTDYPERYGPVSGYKSGYLDVLPDGTVRPAPYDLMPVYFGNCFWDQNHPVAPKQVCGFGVFPFYDSGLRDAVTSDIIPTTWYYGEADDALEDYPGCDPSAGIWDSNGDGTPDLGACQNEWEEAVGADIIQYQRRVRLELPATFAGNPNNFIEIAADGSRTGNTQVADTDAEDYDLDGFTDPDLDGDNANDWMLYVNSVEERNQRTCSPAANLPTWTPTYTVTPTPTETPTPTFTPTPIVDCSKLYISEFTNYSYNDWRAKVYNDLPYEIKIMHTTFTWVPYSSSYYADYFNIDSTGRGTNYSYWGYDTAVKDYGPVTDVDTDRWADPPDQYVYGYPELDGITNGDYFYWYAIIYGSNKGTGRFEVCLDLLVIGGDQRTSPASDYLCEDICKEDWGALNTPTPTRTATPTAPVPTATWPATPTRTATPIGGGGSSTPTRTPTAGFLPTATKTPVPTSTPTFTPTPTVTPVPTTVG